MFFRFVTFTSFSLCVVGGIPVFKASGGARGATVDDIVSWFGPKTIYEKRKLLRLTRTFRRFMGPGSTNEVNHDVM